MKHNLLLISNNVKSDIKTQILTKILKCQFTINIAINNKLGNLGHKHSITTTYIMIINSVDMIMKAIKENVNP